MDDSYRTVDFMLHSPCLVFIDVGILNNDSILVVVSKSDISK